MSKTVVGLFDNREHAETAAKKIKEQGLRTDDISIVAKQGDERGTGTAGGLRTGGTFTGTGGADTTGGAFAGAGGITTSGAAFTGTAGAGDIPAGGSTAGENNRRTNDNISDGVIAGGVLGGIAGLVIGAGSLVVPGLGIIAAAGPIAGLLSGVVTGGIVGGLVDLGIPEKESRQYESDIKQGKILFSMRTDEDKVDRITSILKNSGATSIEAY